MPEAPEAPEAPTPGSRWVWEIDKRHARCLVEVVSVIWSGEDWVITAVSLTPDEGTRTIHTMDRFLEAATPVGASPTPPEPTKPILLGEMLLTAKLAGTLSSDWYRFRTNEGAAKSALMVVRAWLQARGNVERSESGDSAQHRMLYSLASDITMELAAMQGRKVDS